LGWKTFLIDPRIIFIVLIVGSALIWLPFHLRFIPLLFSPGISFIISEAAAVGSVQPLDSSLGTRIVNACRIAHPWICWWIQKAATAVNVIVYVDLS